MVKNLPANAGHKRCWFDPWVWKIPRKKAWQPTPVFLSEEFHGQRSLQATVHEVANSHTPLKGLSTQAWEMVTFRRKEGGLRKQG